LQPLRPKRLCCSPDRYTAQPAVRRQEIHPADAASRPAEALHTDARYYDTICEIPRIGRRRVRRAWPVLSHRLHRKPYQPPLQELPHRTGSLRRPAARTDLRPPALGRISSQAWLRNVGWVGCAQYRALPSELALAESE